MRGQSTKNGGASDQSRGISRGRTSEIAASIRRPRHRGPARRHAESRFKSILKPHTVLWEEIRSARNLPSSSECHRFPRLWCLGATRRCVKDASAAPPSTPSSRGGTPMILCWSIAAQHARGATHMHTPTKWSGLIWLTLEITPSTIINILQQCPPHALSPHTHVCQCV